MGNDIVSTYNKKDHTLYVHMLSSEKPSSVVLPIASSQISKVTALNTGKRIEFRKDKKAKDGTCFILNDAFVNDTIDCILAIKLR